MDSKSLGPDHYSQFGIAFALQMARPLRGLDDHIKCPGLTRLFRSINQSNWSISFCLLFLFCSCVLISRSYENRSKCVTPCNKFVFILNRLQNLSARRPEMTRPLPAKISHIEAGIVHAKTSGSSVRHFVFFWHKRDSFLDWTFPLTGSPIIKCIYHN